MPQRPDSTRADRSPRLLALLALVVLGPLLVVATTVRAQGTSGVLPDPISGRQLSEYAQRIDLSDQQRLAIDDYHSQYLEGFRTLRDGDITEFLDKTNNLMRSFMFAPDSKEARKSLGELNQLMNKIKQLDARLFNEVETVLSEEQVPALARVRQHRERARYRSGLVRFVGYANAGARVDLSTVAESIDLPVDDRDAIDPQVLMYEGELTRSTRKLFDETQAMFADLMKQLEVMTEAAGGQAPRSMWGSLRDILAESSKGVMSQASSISKLNLRTFNTLAAVLPPESARALRSAYYEAAYSEVERPAVAVLSRFDSALALTGLGAERRESIEIARSDLRAQHDRLAVQMIDLLEDIRKDASVLRFGRPRGGAEQEQYETLQKKRNEVNENALERLAAMLGPDLNADLEEVRTAERKAKIAERQPRRAGRAGGGGGAGRAVTVERAADSSRDESVGERAGLDPFLPGPISRAYFKRCERHLSLSDDEQAVLESLHGGYLESFDALRETHVQPILDAAEVLWKLDPDSGRLKPPPAEAIDAQYELRRSALTAINALDESFLLDIRIILSGDELDERMERLRLARARTVYNRSGTGGGASSSANRMMRGFMGGESKEESIDLISMLDRQIADDEAWTRLDPVLVGYERRIVDAFKHRYELLLAVEQASARAGAESAAGRQGDDGRGRRGERRGAPAGARSFQDLMQTSGRELQEAGRVVVGLNRDMLAQLEEMLGEESGAAIRDTYRRTAYPSVYKDSGRADTYLRNALALEDLTVTQRGRISDILEEYLEPYAGLCEKMVDLEVEAAEQNRGDFRNRDWQRFQERRNELERLRFDRNELNDKALRRLRSILAEGQSQRIGLIETD